MFDWLGWKQGLPLWWSYRLNKNMKDDVEDIFESIAQTRMDLLHQWAEEYWSVLERLHQQLAIELLTKELTGDQTIVRQLQSGMSRAADFSEIFIVSKEYEVVCSTHEKHQGVVYKAGSSIEPGLNYVKKHNKPCLFGPYSDKLTSMIGPSTSKFHDAMTLMYILPILKDGVVIGTLCGRVPNDVLGDLIQRESGHVYPDSGDNYIFMAKPGLNQHIQPGTALSRSRFEDLTFTHGENLKDGVRTDWGTVSVKEHTELELIFTDPATNELHPGVANTIRNGNNLFVEFPGYSDYRHISVIGKGVTFQLPHCPDQWGMMCEGDLEEVYRIRSINWKMTRAQFGYSLGFFTLMLAVILASDIAPMLGIMAIITHLLYSAFVIRRTYSVGTRQTVNQLNRINQFIRMNAEGKGDLTQRLKPNDFAGDELKELAKWINNMIDSLEGIMLKVKQAAADVMDSQSLLNQSTSSTETSTQRVNQIIHTMIRGLRGQLKDIDMAKDVVRDMSDTLRVLELQATAQIQVAHGEVGRIGESMGSIETTVAHTNTAIVHFLETTKEITKVSKVIERITAQTNLLALNASIEAARVGEHGKGFAVVAGEIRGLADLTRKSTQEINEMIERIHTQATEAMKSMEVGIRVVGEGSQMVAAASETLHSASNQDAAKLQVVDEVVSLMEKIAGVSIQNRSISTEVEGNIQTLLVEMNQVKHTSEQVEAITGRLQHLVEQFRLTEDRVR